MKMVKRKPFSPGEILLEEFMTPYQLTQEELARRIHVSRRRINEIIHAKRAITTDTALKLAKLFKVSAEYWLNLQTKFDLWNELHCEETLDELKEIKSIKTHHDHQDHQEA